MSITGFFGEHRFLSNFFPSPLHLDGLLFPNVECAFQAAKTLSVRRRRAFQAESLRDRPGLAKRMGRALPLRTDWEAIKIGVMRELLRAKFGENPDLLALLLATDGHLEERNTWGDDFWGTTAPGVGQNWLGILLMEIREEFRKEIAAKETTL